MTHKGLHVFSVSDCFHILTFHLSCISAYSLPFPKQEKWYGKTMKPIRWSKTVKHEIRKNWFENIHNYWKHKESFKRAEKYWKHEESFETMDNYKYFWKVWLLLKTREIFHCFSISFLLSGSFRMYARNCNMKMAWGQVCNSWVRITNISDEFDNEQNQAL